MTVRHLTPADREKQRRNNSKIAGTVAGFMFFGALTFGALFVWVIVDWFAEHGLLREFVAGAVLSGGFLGFIGEWWDRR